MRTMYFYSLTLLIVVLLLFGCGQRRAVVNKTGESKISKNTTGNVQKVAEEEREKVKSPKKVGSACVLFVSEKANPEGDYRVGLKFYAAAFHVSEKAENCAEILEVLRYGVKHDCLLLITTENVREGREVRAYIVNAQKAPGQETTE